MFVYDSDFTPRAHSNCISVLVLELTVGNREMYVRDDFFYFTSQMETAALLQVRNAWKTAP
jgi:hypothetical protein